MALMSTLLDMDASTLATKIREREITSVEATNSYIRHLKKVNPHINALVENRFDQALQEAQVCDETIAKGESTGKLFGVPISMKECFAVKGMRTTGGLPHRRNVIDPDDAVIVQKLRSEGAIILGKTNTPALCFCQETDNTVYGRTNNPWNLKHTAGGSSGGEGSLIAVGGAAVGIGSDIGGSIRFPAHFNGVIGFKSGRQQVSPIGHYPILGIKEQVTMLGIGAMSKSVQDAELIHSILIEEPTEKIDIDEFHYYVPHPLTNLPMSPSTTAIVDAVRSYLTKRHTVHLDSAPYLEESAIMWQLIMSYDGAESLVDIVANGSWRKIVREYTKSRLGMKAELHPNLTWAILGAKTFQPSAKKWAELMKQWETASHIVNQYLHKRILILPVYHSTASKHGKVYKEIFSIRKTFPKYMPYIAYANTFGLPSLVLPVGEDEQGLPISIQLITSIGQEDALFHAGRELEQTFRGYKRCTTWN